MNTAVIHTPRWIEALFPGAVWGDEDRASGPIYLSFDDGPVPGVTPALLATLAGFEVKAMFFVQGNRVRGNEGILRAIRRQGHALGYHGMTHETWWFRGQQRRRSQMDPARLPGEVRKLLNRPYLLRPPYGRMDSATLRTAQDLDATLVQFRLIVGDWLKNKTRDILVRDLYTLAQPGDMVVLHDGSRNGALLPDVLHDVIPRWRDKGLRIGHWRELTGTP